MATEQWYYRLDGKAHGPFTPFQFDKLIRGHTVTPDTEVSTDGKTWQTLRAALTPVAEDSPPNAADWMNATTLLPSDARLPPVEKPEKKADPPG